MVRKTQREIPCWLLGYGRLRQLRALAAELGKVRLNQVVDVRVDSYPNKRFRGTVIQVASISEFTPRNVQSADERRHQVFAIKVRVADPEGVFRSGMAAEVLVPLHEVKN